MKVTINTAVLQKLVSKAVKGSSNNKMLPITGFIEICVNEGILTLATTDATNYLYVGAQLEGVHDEFYAVVQTDLFAKLISKLTCDNVTLSLEDDILTVIGNGRYAIELPLDEEGEAIHFPDKLADFDESAVNARASVKLAVFNQVLATAKSAIAVGKAAEETPCLGGYYFGDKIIASDTYIVCGIDTKVFEKPLLMSAETVALTDLFTEDVEILFAGDKMLFRSGMTALSTVAMEKVEEYPVAPISSLLDMSFDSCCEIPKSALLQLLDRLVLFVGEYDKNSVLLTFAPDGLVISSKQDNSSETIPYKSITSFKAFQGAIDIEMLQSQAKANTGDMLTIHFGEENAIKLTDGNVTQIIALLDE